MDDVSVKLYVMSQYILLQLYKTTYFYFAQPLSRNIPKEHSAEERKPSHNIGKISLQLNFM
jgi:hypothetical protein